MSDKTRNRLEAIASQFDLIASRTTPLYSVALRVTNTSIKILLPEHLNAIDNPHRGSGDLLGAYRKLICYLLPSLLSRWNGPTSNT